MSPPKITTLPSPANASTIPGAQHVGAWENPNSSRYTSVSYAVDHGSNLARWMAPVERDYAAPDGWLVLQVCAEELNNWHILLRRRA